ncbi:hypothetical protein [Sphingomonas sp. ERG5]|uniref:hypothetical protein n=1 Tax=Sphingomonas sp. ERG5 TaxID=1381597 RepID=UPI00068FEA3A|nr:hypothetical protein [Sphingomonas sp. ERG5]
MPGSSGAELELVRFQRRNRQFFIGTTVVILGITAIMGVTLVAMILKGHILQAYTIKRLALIWSPALFYLWALWTLRGIFGALARGGISFQPIITSALAKVGWALLLGALASLVMGPIQLSVLEHHVTGWFATFNVPVLTLGVVGLALIVLARMLRRAARIEAVLGDFV